jgi:hypothetical protein
MQNSPEMIFSTSMPFDKQTQHKQADMTHQLVAMLSSHSLTV